MPHRRRRATVRIVAGRGARVVRTATRVPVWLVMSGLFLILGLMMWLVAAVIVVSLWRVLPGPLVVALMLWAGFRVRRWHRRRVRSAGTAPLPRTPPPPPRPDLAWSRAHARFVALRGEFAAHECDPMAVLRLPALSDVSVPSTARFVDAFAEAQALETDAFPGGGHADAFAAAVARAERAWRAARDAAERIRLSRLSPAERSAVERVIKLLTTARDSDSDAERLAAYARARVELMKLDHAGVVHLPHPAAAVLEVAGRGQLPA